MSHLSEVDERTAADASAVAGSATTHAFLNSYLRETGAGELVDSTAPAGQAIRFELPTVGVEIVAPLSYRSPTGRHLFDLPARFRAGDDNDWTDLDYATLASLVVKELSLERSGDNVADELLSRVLSSKRATERFSTRAPTTRSDCTAPTSSSRMRNSRSSSATSCTRRRRVGRVSHTATRRRTLRNCAGPSRSTTSESPPNSSRTIRRGTNLRSSG